MFVLISVLITSAGLSLMLALAERGQSKLSNSQEIFRYATATIWILFVAIAGASALVASVFRRLSREGHMDTFDWMTIGALGLVDMMFVGVMIYARYFSVSVDSDQILVRSLLSGSRNILFADLGRLDVIQGAKSEELSLFRKDGKRVFNVGATLQGFGQLVRLLETRVQKFGVSIRHRDKYGKWS